MTSQKDGDCQVNNTMTKNRKFAGLQRFIADAPHYGAFWWASVVVLAIIGLSEYSYYNSSQHMKELARLESQRSVLNDLRRTVVDAEAAQRGFLFTGNQAYLEPYRQAAQQLDPILNSLRDYYDDDPGKLGGFATISRPISRKFAEMELGIKMRQNAVSNNVDWQAVIETDLGRQYMQAINDGMNTLREENHQAIMHTSNLVHRNLAMARFAVVVISLLGLHVFYLLIRQSRMLAQSHIQRSEELQQERDQLEQMVQQRTQKLTQLTSHVIHVQEEERGRIARDLHDEMGSLLTAAKLDAARIRSRMKQLEWHDDTVSDGLQHLLEALNASVAFKRQLIEDLQPSALQQLGLTATLENYVREFGQRNDIRAEADIEAVSLSKESILIVLRVVQEALTNVLKHARANRVKVTLHNKGAYALLTIEDDGLGFDVEKRFNESYGLPGVLHRIEEMRGKLKIRSAPGKGSRIEAALPQEPLGPPAPPEEPEVETVLV